MRFSKFPFVLLLSAMVAAMFLATAPGCASSAEVQAERARAIAEKEDLEQKTKDAEASVATMKTSVDELRAEKDRLAGIAKQLEAGSPGRIEVETTVAQVVSRLTSLDSAIAEATAASAAAKETAKKIGDRIAQADTILADPGEKNPGADIGSLIGLLIPGAAALAPVVGGLLWRGSRLTKAKTVLEGTVKTKSTALERIVASIEVLADVAPEVRTAIQKNAHVIDAIQTPLGKMEVDRAQARIDRPEPVTA